ncbi:6534_t:CDS:1, partial [Dentiscutata erythropus]
ETRVDLLYDAYSRYFKQENQYITKKDGKLNLKMFLKFLIQLSKLKPGTIRRGSIIPEETVKDETIIAKRANDYLKTICWTFQYYNGDCPSWRYFYPHHRPPTIPEILTHVKVENFDQTFKKDSPLRPFEQLICILPPNASYLVPAPFRPLFTNPDSPLKEYFPKTFKTSNHKALLPFVDEEHLIQAMKPGYSLLKKEDTLRDMLNGRTHIYAGRCSASYSAVFSLCSGRCRVPNFPISSVVFGKLLYDGPMLKSIEPPVNEFQKIN